VEEGTIVFQVEPPGTVLHVFMDTFKVGTTPLASRSIRPGSYTLEFKDDQKRLVARRRVVVKEGRVSLVRINLQEE
jgi:hypothetical protein